MAFPLEVPRIAPTGFKILNGYQALLTFENDHDANYFEIAVGVPGLDSGDPVDTTTQLNETYRTTTPRALVGLTSFQVTAAYAALGYSNLLSLLGINQNITVFFADGSSISFWGFLQTVEFDPQENGTMPTLTLTITPTNFDPDNCVEAGPLLTDAGTC